MHNELNDLTTPVHHFAHTVLRTAAGGLLLAACAGIGSYVYFRWLA
jgi:hypothetical protein